MKILILNTHSHSGGAARAAKRLHKSLLASGIDSKMLVLWKESDDPTIIPVISEKKAFIAKMFKAVRRIFNRIPETTIFSTNGFLIKSVLSKIDEINPDVVHLHWVNEGFLNIKTLSKIKQPIVWTLHDMYPFTGGCHYDEGCGLYKERCQECKILTSNTKLGHRQWKWKEKQFSNIPNLTIIGLSRWLQQCSKESSLFQTRDTVNLPNPIDTSIFAPYSKREARKLLNLPLDKKLVLFGAMLSTSDPRKGFAELATALKLVEISNMEAVIFGSSEPSTPPDFGCKARYLGHLHDDITLRLLYSAADVMVVPSLQEVFGQTITESFACGTLVVAFNSTGPKDIIDHKENGYLAEPYSPEDLARGIEWGLNLSEEEYRTVSQNARIKVLRYFDSELVAKQYIELYKKILNSH